MATVIAPDNGLLQRVQEHSAAAARNYLRSDSSSNTGSGALIATICVLIIVLLGAGVGYVLLRRVFIRKKQNAPLRTFVGDQSGA